jgi:hypothetical protein
MSYQHIGQHGEADYHYVVEQTKPAKPDEYMPLYKELKEIGYDLQVRQKINHHKYINTWKQQERQYS